MVGVEMVANKMYFQHAPKGNYLPVKYWYCTVPAPESLPRKALTD